MNIQLIEGECLEVMKGLPDNSVDMILCDLPYGTTQNPWDSLIPLDKLWLEYERLCRGAIVLTAQSPFDKVLGCSNLSLLKYEWIWAKESGTGHLNAKIAPLKNHENVLVFYHKCTYNPQMRGGFKSYYCKQGFTKSGNYGSQTGAVTDNGGDRYPLSIIEFKRDRKKVHPTQKPLALFEYLVKTYTDEGDTVLDNCAGSGTTGVACLNLGRKGILIEREPAYCAIIRKRLAEAELEKLNTIL